MKDIIVICAARGKKIMEKLDLKYEIGKDVTGVMKLHLVLKE